jgi:putative transposase
LQRRQIVKLVRAGSSLRRVGQRFGVRLGTVQYWVRRASGQRLDRVDWSDRSSQPATIPNLTAASWVRLIIKARRALRASPLGECGAKAIHAHLQTTSRQLEPVPSVRTIGRVLLREGLLDGKRRTRRPAPPRGWYLPLLAEGKAELDSFDIVEGLFIAGGIEVEVLNAMSLHGRLAGSWPQGRFKAEHVMDCLMSHWQTHGLPHYVQFDNAPLFQGPISYADRLGKVVRLCLQLGVTPVFAPPRETGFQAAIESYNARWQLQVWQRFKHPDFTGLHQRSSAYVAACHLKVSQNIAKASTLRHVYPASFCFNDEQALSNTVIFLKRTNAEGRVTVMGRLYEVDANWQHRLLRVEVNFTKCQMEFFALRRSAPTWQPLLHTLPYKPAAKQPRGLRALVDGATGGLRLDKRHASPRQI